MDPGATVAGGAVGETAAGLSWGMVSWRALIRAGPWKVPRVSVFPGVAEIVGVAVVWPD